ncbi:MAG: DUF1934 family protein [Clostridia bacterium]|nr:DUF1934 family protein [Clostridia bacterium]
MERVTVRRVSTITPASGAPETESGEWVGALRETQSELLLTFTETVEGGRIFNRVIWRDGTLTVDRRGAASSRIEFRAGETQTVELSFPPFTLQMTVSTREILLLPTPVGVGFRVSFFSEINGERRENELTVTASPL